MRGVSPKQRSDAGQGPDHGAAQAGRPRVGQATADRVSNIIEAAEETAQKIERDAEARLRERLAEGDRGADYRIEAAEKEAQEILSEARQEAERLRAEAEATSNEAAGKALSFLSDARQTADGVRSEGLELVSNLREMGNSLRGNADRLLNDIRQVHSRMLDQLDMAEQDVASRSGGSAASHRRDLPEPPSGEVLDVPEFIP
jgi:vacuolar-type H+-ATPase subunit H